MKKIMQLLSLAIMLSAVLFIQSCDDEENIQPAPSVILDASSGQAVPGGSVTINATVSAPNGGQSLVVYVAGVEEEAYDMAGAVDFAQEFTYAVPASAVIGSTIVISFQAIDSRNYPSAISNYTLTVGDPVITLQGNLATMELTAGQVYLIKGQTFVPSGVTLTIPAGTVIKGDKASKGTLIVQPGGKLIANGTAASPVVFTSAQAVGERDRGDWGGIVMLGDAWVNQTGLPAIEGISPTQNYGNITSPTTNETQNAGTLTYVRIEYAGIELTPNNETNSLTMGGLGNGTTIDHVQVSFGGDDGFEWFGGTVNAKHLVSLSTWDDDFDTDYGWGGNVQFGLVVRNPFFADQSGSNSFESDNQSNANATPANEAGYTRGIFSNITVLGPRDFNSPSRSISANYQNTIHIRRRTSISIFNSVFAGFRIGLRLDDQATYDNFITNGSGKLAYNTLLVPGVKVTGTSASDAEASFVTGLSGGDATALKTYWDANNNTTMNPTAASGAGSWTSAENPYTGLGINPSLFWGGQNSSTYPSNPNFAVTTGTLTNTGNFSDAKLSGNTFFEATTYQGAFGTTDWTDGWAEFQPLSKAF